MNCSRRWSQTLESAPTIGEHARLSPRERDVMGRIAKGLTNRQIAAELSISHRTVEAHRARAVLKLKAPAATEFW